MVFIALPALQRSQRDAQRKQDVNRMSDATNHWLANNHGKSLNQLIGSMNFLRNSGYLGDVENFKDPDGQPYSVVLGEVGVLPTVRKTSAYSLMYRFLNARCDGENTVPKPGINNFAISIVLEGGGVYCTSN